MSFRCGCAFLAVVGTCGVCWGLIHTNIDNVGAATLYEFVMNERWWIPSLLSVILLKYAWNRYDEAICVIAVNYLVVLVSINYLLALITVHYCLSLCISVLMGYWG